MGKQTKEVPQWVRDFITQRQRQLYEEQHSKKDETVRMDDNVYLLNPFSQDEVELIRNGVWKLREEAALAWERENRKQKEAGKLSLYTYSGFSNRDDLFDMFVRPLLLVPLNRQEMQEAVVRRCGWEKWSEDPWGDAQSFYEWLGNVRDKDDTPALWAINETLAGRTFLTYCTLRALRQLDFSKMTDKDLFDYDGFGAMNFRYTKRYTGWDDFHSHYPVEPLPAALVNKEIIKGSLFSSLNVYVSFVVSIYVWYFTSPELDKRTKEHPELEHFLSYHIATDALQAWLRQELAPNGYQPPDKREAWEKLEQALKKRLEAKAAEYDDVFSLRSELEDDVLKESYVEAQAGLFEGVNYWKSKAYEAVIAGLKGQLGNSLLSIVKHDLIDSAKKAYRKHEVTESQMDATRVTDEDKVTPFLDTIPSPESQESMPLEELALPLDKLTPRELIVIKDVYEALAEGYSFNSKQGLPFIVRWGKDYGKNIKAFNRAKSKLRQL